APQRWNGSNAAAFVFSAAAVNTATAAEKLVVAKLEMVCSDRLLHLRRARRHLHGLHFLFGIQRSEIIGRVQDCSFSGAKRSAGGRRARNSDSRRLGAVRIDKCERSVRRS